MNKLLIPLLIFMTGCTGLNIHVKDNNPYKSFVRLTRIVHTFVCHEVDGHPECVDLQPTAFHASGIIIGEDDEHSFILTAGHFCQDVHSDQMKLNAIFQQNSIPPDPLSFFEKATFADNFIVNDYRGNNYFSRLIEWNTTGTDLCLVSTDGKMSFGPIPIADEEPEIGDRIFMASAPFGIHTPGMALILDGFWSGKVWHPFFNKPAISVTDFPLLPGSSGAGILNEDKEIVSIAMGTNMHFPHDGYGVTLKQIKEFVEVNLKIERNRFQEWFNSLF